MMETSILKELHQSQETPWPGRARTTKAHQLGWFYLSPQIKGAESMSHAEAAAEPRAEMDRPEVPSSLSINMGQEQAAPASLDLSSASAEAAEQKNTQPRCFP